MELGMERRIQLRQSGDTFLRSDAISQEKPTVRRPNARDHAFWRIPIGDTEINAMGMTQRAMDKSRSECKAMMDILLKKQNPGKMPTVVSYLSSMKDKHNALPFISDCGHVGLCPPCFVARR
jgi:hypothetical protein